MTKLLHYLGYSDQLYFKDKVVYIINSISFCLALLFILFYLYLIKFLPAIPSTALYLMSCIAVFNLLRKKYFKIAKLLVIIAFLLQDSAVVFMWFPRETGFNFYYFIIAPITFFIYDFDKKDERFLIIFFNAIATTLLLLSEIIPTHESAIAIETNILWFFKGISVATASGSIAFVFYIYATNLTRVHNELKYLANTDGLTRIFNRRVMFEEGEKQFSVCKKYDRDFTLALIDIDFFKRINDQYGHPAGDEILIQLTKLISSSIRQNDIFSRYGGEEFAIILKDTTQGYAFQIIDKLRIKIENHTFIVENNISIKLTISAGMVQFSDAYASFDLMVRNVDNYLYQAKNGGRNKVIQQNSNSDKLTKPDHM